MTAAVVKSRVDYQTVSGLLIPVKSFGRANSDRYTLTESLKTMLASNIPVRIQSFFPGTVFYRDQGFIFS